MNRNIENQFIEVNSEEDVPEGYTLGHMSFGHDGNLIIRHPNGCTYIIMRNHDNEVQDIEMNNNAVNPLLVSQDIEDQDIEMNNNTVNPLLVSQDIEDHDIMVNREEDVPEGYTLEHMRFGHNGDLIIRHPNGCTYIINDRRMSDFDAYDNG